MKLHPRLTRSCIELVKRFEGFRPAAARTPDGGWTLGYGHTLTAREGAVVSEADADALLRFDLSRVADVLDEALLAPVNDNQFSALISFAFNIGPENFKGSSAARHLAEGAYLQAAAAIELWRRADFGGDALVVDALVRRRAAEKALFLTPPEGFAPAPSSVMRPSFDHSVIGAAVAWAAARERTAVSRIALEGAMTSPDLAVPPGRDGEPAPSAAIAAADALTARLSRILPDEPEAPVETPASPEPLTLVAEDAPADDALPLAEAATAAAPAAPTLNFTTGAPDRFRPDARYEPSPPPAQPLSVTPPERIYDTAFDLPPPPAPRFDPPAFVREPGPTEAEAPSALEPIDFGTAETAATPPPFVETAEPAPFQSEPEPEPTPMVFGARRRRFGPRAASAVSFTPMFTPVSDVPGEPSPEPLAATPTREAAPFEAAGTAAPPPFPVSAPSFFDPPAARFNDGYTPVAFDPPAEVAVEGAEAPTAAPTPLFENPLFFAGLGLLGVALFAGSIFCMINKASFGCLLIGVVGVLAMAPAAAFFLCRFLGQPVEPGAEEHAEMMQAIDDDVPPAEAAAEADPFAQDSWR